MRFVLLKIISVLIFLPWMGSDTLVAQEGSAKGGMEDTTSAEYWRRKGFEARVNGDMEQSLQNYLHVLTLDPSDWDANLAVARLYFAKEDYKASAIHYQVVYENDSTNTEALWGIGRSDYRMGNFKEAVIWYRKALVFLPGHLPLLEDLSHALVNSNQSQEALKVYQEMLSEDSSIALAWVGIGKISQLTGKPATALKYYKKALALDPGNKEIADQQKQVQSEMAFTAGYQFLYINEQEPIDIGIDTAAYNINALLQRITISKRVSDRLFLTFSHLLDRSTREYYQQETEKRWYDNTSLRAMLVAGNHRVNLQAGVSFEEKKWTSYGLSWDYGKKLGKLRINNTLSAGYDYYYYWNQVGHDYVSDLLRFSLGNLMLEASYRYVNVRELFLIELDTLGRNPGHQYALAGKYTFFKNPKVTLGIYHQYRDYKYRSTRYWSPQERTLNGATATVYWDSKKGLYAYVSGNIGQDSYEISHWEASGEVGYTHKKMSFSLGASRFYNPWYENFIAYMSVTKRF